MSLQHLPPPFRSQISPLTVSFLLFLAVPVLTEQRAQGDEEVSNQDCLDCHAAGNDLDARLEVNPKDLAGSPHNEDNGVTCVSCHVKAAKVEDISEHGPLGKAACGECHEVEAEIKKGVHGRADRGKKPPTCASCHDHAHKIIPASKPGSPTSARGQMKTCGACHGTSPLKTFLASVHGKALEAGNTKAPSCTDCHGQHGFQRLDIFNNPSSKVAMVAACSACHKEEALAYEKSVHSKAIKQGNFAAASCVDCHIGHDILPASDARSSVHASHVAEDCSRCHGDQRLIRRFNLPVQVVPTYESSYHGRAGELGEIRVANCSSCHRAHDIFPSRDPLSSVHKGNLATSCGKCHPGADESFVTSKIHVKMASSSTENYWAWFVGQIYTWLIALVIGGMLLHNILDFLRKMKLRARRQRHEAHVVRMTRLERWAHALLFTSFIYLAYSGFALIWPKAWWVTPLNWISETETFRATSHHVAGVILCLIALHHAWFLFFHPLGKEQRRHFWPRLHDFRDLWHNLQWFLGRRSERPRFGRFGYMEKAEYWALVWGTVIMAATGFVLWFENEALQVMPLWLWEVFQVVHRFEAILAVLAVIVWHFYYVFINPDESPMSLTWITGRISREELELLHPEEHEELERREHEAKDDDTPG